MQIGWCTITLEKKNHGLFIRDKNNHPLVFCKKNNKVKNITENIINASFFGTYEFEGNKLVPAFELIAKEFLNDDYKPSNISYKIDINNIKEIEGKIAKIDVLFA